MRETIQDSVTRLIRYQRAPATATGVFRRWKHNSDILPRLRNALEALLDAYGKFEPVVYDMQGILDDGSDVAIHCRPPEGGGTPEIIGFQVKSFDDLAKKDYMRELKAQRDDSLRKVQGLSYYFMVLCTDAKTHRDRIRNIEAEFRSADRTEVIEPEFAYTFLNLPKTRIEAHVKRVMEADDIVFRRALASIELPFPFARALIVFFAIKLALTGATAYTLGELHGDESLRSIYKELSEQQAVLLEQSLERTEVPSLDIELREGSLADEDEYNDEEEYQPVKLVEFDEQIATDLDFIDTSFVELDANSDVIRVLPEQMQPLLAVVTDALVRYEYNEAQLSSYMFDLMIRD